MDDPLIVIISALAAVCSQRLSTDRLLCSVWFGWNATLLRCWIIPTWFGLSQRNLRNVTKWRHYWIGQSQPPATYAAGTRGIIEIKLHLHHTLHNKSNVLEFGLLTFF